MSESSQNNNNSMIDDTFKRFIQPNEGSAPNTVLGPNTSLLPNAGERILAAQTSLNTLLSQKIFLTTLNMSATDKVGQVLYNIQHDFNLFSTAYSKLFDAAAKWYKFLRFDVKVFVLMQGYKQCQGAIICNTLPYTSKLIESTTKRFMLFPTGSTNTTDLMFLMPRTIIPFMESSETEFYLPWLSNINAFPLHGIEGFKFFTLDVHSIANSSLIISTLDPLRVATGVDTVPSISIFCQLSNLRYGVFEPDD